MREGDYIVIPRHVGERVQRNQELARIRQARYRHKYTDTRISHHPPASEREFIAWDGEGPRDAGYALFGSSAGDRICHPFLGTTECLDLLIDCETRNRDAIHIAYGFNYDVSMILKDLSWRHLSALHNYGRTVWREYEIQHIPHKWFKVRHGGITIQVFDIHSFFVGSYVGALESFGIGTDDQLLWLRTEKARRGDFLWAEIGSIEEYWRLELSLMPELAQKLRMLFLDAGYLPRSWHGPGALAREALSRHVVYGAMAESPPRVKEAAQSAFAGGRFELFQAGHVKGKVFNADIHSAYPYFATGLPNLARGHWRHCDSFEPGKFGVYHVQYQSRPGSYAMYPLFRRLASGEVVWPYRVTGWYWTPEAELVANDPDATFLGGWVFDENDETDRPFTWLEEYYRRRMLLKGQGNAAEFTFKLIINSVYGQLAQRAGWNRKDRTPPRSHQLEWAGFITSACRAAVYRAGESLGDKLISIDTDGIHSLAPSDGLDTGNALGQWELTEYDDGIFWQSGIYCLKEGGDWIKARTRGIPKGSYTYQELLDCLERREPLRLDKKVFVTYGLADQGRRDLANTWQTEPHEFAFGGNGKRQHIERACPSVCGSGMHRLAAWQGLYGPDGSPDSILHPLPWLSPPSSQKGLIGDLLMYDADGLDPDDEWVRAYA